MIFDIDYINIYFEIPVLDKIHGESIYNSLHELKQQSKVNATQVTSDLCGGTNGYLGLVLTPTEYIHIHRTPYAKPVHPGKLLHQVLHSMGPTGFEMTTKRPSVHLESP